MGFTSFRKALFERSFKNGYQVAKKKGAYNRRIIIEALWNCGKDGDTIIMSKDVIKNRTDDMSHDILRQGTNDIKVSFVKLNESTDIDCN